MQKDRVMVWFERFGLITISLTLVGILGLGLAGAREAKRFASLQSQMVVPSDGPLGDSPECDDLRKSCRQVIEKSSVAADTFREILSLGADACTTGAVTGGIGFGILVGTRYVRRYLHKSTNSPPPGQEG